MKNRIPQYNAFIPALGIILPGVVYNYGNQIGVPEEALNEIMKGKFDLEDDQVFKLNHAEGDKCLLELFATEDFYWVEDPHFNIMYFTGGQYKDGKDIFEGDIVKYFQRIGVIEYDIKQLRYVLKSGYDKVEMGFDKFALNYLTYLGNIYTQPHLNKKPL